MINYNNFRDISKEFNKIITKHLIMTILIMAISILTMLQQFQINELKARLEATLPLIEKMEPRR